jgi:hypothetical protein
MAYSAPTSRSAGYTVDSTEWNKNTVDNPIALRAGEIAISGQAEHALIVADSATQLATVAVPSRGAVLYAGASGEPSWLAAGTSGYVLTAGGAGADPSWVSTVVSPSLNRDVAEATVGPSDTAETTVFSYTVPGGTLSTNKMLRVTLLGDYFNNSGGTSTFTVRAKFGGTTFFSANPTLAALATRRQVVLNLTLSAFNSTSAQVGSGSLYTDNNGDASNGVATSMIAAPGVWYAGMKNNLAIASASDAVLLISFQHGTSNASISAKSHVVQVELI